jgi:hypothetical protein
MNIIFHTLTGLATTAVLSSTDKGADPSGWKMQWHSWMLALGFIAGILVHGLLDISPHCYPIKSTTDLALSLLFFIILFIIVCPRYRLLLCISFIGSVLPDIVDLGPAMLNRRLGWSLPVAKIFPWHWHRFSGSIYDGSRGAISVLCHLAVIASSIALLCACRKRLFCRRDCILKKEHRI